MNKREAQRIVWKRLAETARTDVDLGDWIADDYEDEKDQQRIADACLEVAAIIEHNHLRGR